MIFWTVVELSYLTPEDILCVYFLIVSMFKPDGLIGVENVHVYCDVYCMDSSLADMHKQMLKIIQKHGHILLCTIRAKLSSQPSWTRSFLQTNICTVSQLCSYRRLITSVTFIEAHLNRLCAHFCDDWFDHNGVCVLIEDGTLPALYGDIHICCMMHGETISWPGFESRRWTQSQTEMASYQKANFEAGTKYLIFIFKCILILNPFWFR